MPFMAYYRRMMRHSALMEAMIARLGLAERIAAKIDAAGVTRRAASRCMTCRAADACESWLAEAEAPKHAPGFCRNAGLFERLTREIEADAAHTVR